MGSDFKIAVKGAFRKAVDQSPVFVQKLRLQFHRATMTDAQERLLSQVAQTRAPLDTKGDEFTFSGPMPEKDAAKVLHVLTLELTQKGEGNFATNWTNGAPGTEVITRRNSAWFNF